MSRNRLRTQIDYSYRWQMVYLAEQRKLPVVPKSYQMASNGRACWKCGEIVPHYQKHYTVSQKRNWRGWKATHRLVPMMHLVFRKKRYKVCPGSNRAN